MDEIRKPVTETDKPVPENRLARRTALAFALFGSLWVLLSDGFLVVLAPDPAQFAMLQTYKGWFFVAASALLIYGVVSHLERERSRASSTLAANEGRYRLLFGANPHPMWVYALETMAFLEVNDVAIATYGYPRDEFLSMTLFDILPAEDAAQVRNGLVQAASVMQHGEWRQRRRNGEIFVVEITSHELEFAGRPARLVVAMDISSRIQAEHALRVSERLLARSQEIAHIGHWIWDARTNRVRVSEEMQRIFAIDPEFLDDDLERIVANAVHPEDAGRVLAGFQEFLECGAMRGDEMRVPHADGSERIIRSIPADRVLEESGKVIQLSGVVQDITEYRHAEATLNLQVAALEAAANGILITDTQGRIVWVNAAFSRLTGYSAQESIGRNPNELIHSGMHDRSFYERMWSTILAGNVWQGELINRRKDGSTYTEEQTITPVVNSRGRISHFVAIKQDVTARKLAEAERETLLATTQAQAEQMMQIMHSVPDGILLLDASARVLVANPCAIELVTMLAGPDVLDGSAPLTQLGDCQVVRLLNAQSSGARYTIKGADRIIESSASPLATGPTPQGWVLVLHDITEERAIERQLQRQERLAAIGHLAAGIAHDFNNIMSVISAYAQMMIQATGLTERERERMSAIDRQSMRATRMIRQILDFSRSSVMERQSLDLLALVKEQVALLQQTLPEDIEIELTYANGADSAYIIQGDPTRLQQMLMNLAVNARDAMPKGGFLRFDLANLRISDHSSLPFPGMKLGPWVRLTVADTGTGMSSDIIEHIFEPFFTTKASGEGTGLGLAQVHGIVAQHGGEITVSSRDGEGTGFSVYLPGIVSIAPGMELSPEISAPTGNGAHILLVEDHAALRTTLAELITDWNYVVDVAEHGEAALAMIEAASEPYDLVVSDVVMPKMGGVGLLRALYQRRIATPVVLLTGHPMRDELDSLRDYGLRGWLTKPPDADALARMIADAVASPSAAVQ